MLCQLMLSFLSFKFYEMKFRVCLKGPFPPCPGIAQDFLIIPPRVLSLPNSPSLRPSADPRKKQYSIKVPRSNETKRKRTIVENRTTACIFPHLLFFLKSSASGKESAKEVGRLKRRVRRTPHLTGFSVLRRCLICMQLQTTEQTQTNDGC